MAAGIFVCSGKKPWASFGAASHCLHRPRLARNDLFECLRPIVLPHTADIVRLAAQPLVAKLLLDRFFVITFCRLVRVAMQHEAHVACLWVEGDEVVGEDDIPTEAVHLIMDFHVRCNESEHITVPRSIPFVVIAEHEMFVPVQSKCDLLCFARLEPQGEIPADLDGIFASDHFILTIHH